MCTAVATGVEETQEEREGRLSSLCWFRMIGLTEAITMACFELHRTVPECSELGNAKITKADLDQFADLVRSTLTTISGTGTGDAFHLTERALRLEEVGVRFFDELRTLADHYRIWAHGKGFTMEAAPETPSV